MVRKQHLSSSFAPKLTGHRGGREKCSFCSSLAVVYVCLFEYIYTLSRAAQHNLLLSVTVLKIKWKARQANLMVTYQWLKWWTPDNDVPGKELYRRDISFIIKAMCSDIVDFFSPSQPLFISNLGYNSHNFYPISKNFVFAKRIFHVKLTNGSWFQPALQRNAYL